MKPLKKYIALAVVCAALVAGITALPSAVEASVPVAATVTPKEVYYNEYVLGSGSLCYIGQSDVTSALPLVIKDFTVEPGDTVSVGDVVARVDRDATESFIGSLGKVSQLASASLSTAMAFIPDEVTSDRSGRVISTAGNGSSVESGSSICTIAGTDDLVLTAAVSELDIARIELGQRVRFTCSAYPEEEFTGTVARIAAAARSQYSGAVLETVVDVLIAPDEADPRLKSGLTADVRFEVSDTRKICVLPYEAIGQDDEGEYIYVFEDNTAVRRKIFTGAEFSDGTEIVKGAAAGERVILEPENIALSRYVRIEE
ncbi:MAG: efflux RND transporter periplasmic adaptor subunit [Oscillospiraceae bacterium]